MNNKFISSIPSIPHGKIVDKDGYPTSIFMSFLDQWIQYCQKNLSDAGITPPNLTTDQINQLTNSQNGARVYNTTTKKNMVKEDGTFKNITTS